MCTCFLSHRPQLQIASSLKEGTVHYNSLCPIITLANQVFKNGERTLSWVDIILSVPHSSLPSLYPLAAIFLYLCRLASPSGWPTLPPLWTVLTSLPLISASLWMAVLYQSSHFTWIPKTYLPVSPLKSNLPSLLSHPRWCIESLYLVWNHLDI